MQGKVPLLPRPGRPPFPTRS